MSVSSDLNTYKSRYFITLMHKSSHSSIANKQSCSGEIFKVQLPQQKLPTWLGISQNTIYINGNTCGVLHFMSYQMKGPMFTPCSFIELSQRNQTHLKYLKIKSNKTFAILLRMNRVRQGQGRGPGGGSRWLWSSLSVQCIDEGERRWHWIQWPPQGESPPCLWWMGRLRRSAGAPRCRQTRMPMLWKEERKNCS